MTSPEKRYEACVERLFRLQRVGIKLSLDNIRRLLAAVGDPHLQWPAIHVAGTNGKGSTAAMMAAVLQAGGYRTALYTSPHLVDFRERMVVNNVPVDGASVVAFCDAIWPLVTAITPSFFEVTTAMAFWHFAREKADIAVVETGMGGRLDSTNVVQPLATVITPIAMDHQNYLGETISEIAAEKAGIIKTGVPCLTGVQHQQALTVLQKTCLQKNSVFYNMFDNGSCRIQESDLRGSTFDLAIGDWRLPAAFVSLPGRHQLDNVLLATSALRLLRERLPLGDDAFREGLGALHWRGRLHLVSDSPRVMVDVSHNPQGVAAAFEMLRSCFARERIHAITFLQSDKDYQGIARLLVENAAQITIVDLPAGKPLEAGRYRAAIRAAGGDAAIARPPDEFIEQVWAAPQDDRLQLFIGSHYLAGAVYQSLARRSLA